MPGLEFFSQLGLYVIPKFLPEDACRELIDIMAAAPKKRGETIGGGGKNRLDEARRSVGDAQVPKVATAEELKQSLLNLHSDLERHFGMPLEWGGEGPDYLVYRSGDFFKPHRDNEEYPPAPNSRVLRRRVAVILFLNGYSREYQENCFGGGLLNFYGLFDGPQWKECAFALEPEPGLLVAFPSGLMHEVTPVTFGERYSILTGFHAPLASSQSSSQ
jgi:SM-20-related protein